MALNALPVSQQDRVWIGVDPGGKKNFGLAILKANGSARAWRVDCADEAIEVVVEQVKTKPAGVGVDAPLWWSSGLSSDRYADQWLRKRYGLSGGQVQTANSLRGAALVQGAMFVHRVRQHFPNVCVTETHPKAVVIALEAGNWSAFSHRFGLTAAIGSEHERDAFIAAAAAREGFEGRWTNDLSVTRHPSEQDPSRIWLAPIHYFWPEP